MDMASTIQSQYKFQRRNVGDMKDIISSLPDSILHFILSLLPYEDVVKTSTLAQRWRYLWTYLPASDFEICPLQYDTLNLPSEVHFPGSKTLELSHVTFANDLPSLIHFERLKLSWVTFANEISVLQTFSGCLVLQELTFHNCCWKNIKQVSLTIPTLTKLIIYSDPYCPEFNNLDRCTIKIDAANLLSLRCTSNPTLKVVMVNSTSIRDARINLKGNNATSHYAIDLLSELSSVKSLKLSDDTLKCLSNVKDSLHLLPLFHNLTHLNVKRGFSHFTDEVLMDILPKTPNLEVLSIPVGFEYFLDEDWKSDSVPHCFKSSLKLFCISGFDGDKDEIRLVKFLLKNAPVLGEIRIFCSSYLSADLGRVDIIKSQLQQVCPESCAIKFRIMEKKREGSTSFFWKHLI